MILHFPPRGDRHRNAPPESMRVLVVEDRDRTTSYVRRLQWQRHLTIERTDSGDAARALAYGNLFDVIILTLPLDGDETVELCRQMRLDGVETSVLVILAHGTVDDVVTALDAGADDCLIEPVRFDLLLARVGSLARKRVPAVTGA